MVRREGSQVVTYTHYGVGNYHPITARIYTDLSFFTCDAVLERDATKVFNFLSGHAQPDAWENLPISPNNLKADLIAMIDAEIAYAKAGRPAEIGAKTNPPIEPEAIDALYRASQGGVKVPLVIRDLWVSSEDQRVERDHSGEICRGAVFGTFADCVFRERSWAPGCPSAGIHVICGLDGTEFEPTGRDPGGDPQPDRTRTDRKSDHGGKPRGCSAALGDATQRSVSPGTDLG